MKARTGIRSALRKAFAAAAAAAVILGCGGAAAETVRIGTLPASDSILLIAASEDGLFAKEGLDIALVPFRSAMEIGAAMRAGELAGHYGDIMNVLTQNASGAPQKIVATMTTAGGGQRNFALLVSPAAAERIPTLDALKAKRGVETAMSSSTIIDYLLTRLEETAGVPGEVLKRAEIRQIPIRLQMLLAGKMDTALLPEPLATVVEQKGGRALWDDRALSEPLAVVAFRNEKLNPDFVKHFRAALLEAEKRIESDPEKYRAMMVEKRLLPPPAAKAYAMPRYSEKAGPDGLLPLPAEADIRRVGDWMVGKGMLKAVPAASEVVER